VAIQIKDNFLPNLFFNKLSSIFNNTSSHKLNWFWKYNTDSDVSGDGNFMFTHMLWDFDVGESSPYFAIFEPILYFLDAHVKVAQLRRMKLNLYTNQGKRIEHAEHYDYTDIKNLPQQNHNVTVLNFNTCNGGTVVNNKEYKSVENQAIIFDNTFKHYGIVQTDAPKRIVLNILTKRNEFIKRN
jgi:hypothetical protein